MGLDGRVALVTGGCRGIGAAISESLARSGAMVAAGYRDVVRAEEFAADMDEAGLTVSLHEGNVGEPADCQRVVDEVIEQYGRLDILVNNAGITVDKTVRRMSIDDWHAVLRVNLSGAFYMSKAALEHLLDNGWGRIVNITSVIGEMGNIGQANYAASKSGMVGLTKSLALECATKGVTVNCVSPGFVATDMVDAIPEAIREGILDKVPIRRFAEPYEIARAVTFLADDDAGYITGSVLAVNGGLEM